MQNGSVAWKPMLIVGGLSYLMSVVVGSIRVDLTGNSEIGRYFYCELEPQVANSNVYANMPIFGVVILTSVTIIQKMIESHKAGSEMLLFELCLASAMLLVCVPLYFKCNQLISSGCSLWSTSDRWPVHQNLLMFHVCVLQILAGTAFGEMWILMHELRRMFKQAAKKGVHKNVPRK